MTGLNSPPKAYVLVLMAPFFLIPVYSIYNLIFYFLPLVSWFPSVNNVEISYSPLLSSLFPSTGFEVTI